ncbi:MAG TPA: site-specific integrase [Xanthobacteraceae bacterium]|nr:site-specific integrase [Xanthobacteraceae bacterium]
MAKQKITKTVVDSLKPGTTLWDTEVRGFGVRRQAGGASYILKSRVAGRQTFDTIGKHGSPWTPDTARKEALRLRAAIAHGMDPGAAKAAARAAPTLRELADAYLLQHVEVKRKKSTGDHYRDILTRLVLPKYGAWKAAAVTTADIAALHYSLREVTYQANRMLAVVGAMYVFGQRRSMVPTSYNPARGIEKYREVARERHLSDDELSRLGEALRTGEATGFPWTLNESAKAKHRARSDRQVSKLDPYGAAAIRLLMFTGARLREILHLRWIDVDIANAVIRLPDSKTGAKTIALNQPAVEILASLTRLNEFVIASPGSKNPRADLKGPWRAVRKHAGLDGVRIHDLRHTHASKAVEIGLSLPVIGKLLGHKHAVTTQRYAHMQTKPLQDASNVVALRIRAALNTAA